jgi:hypothetical protein
MKVAHFKFIGESVDGFRVGGGQWGVLGGKSFKRKKTQVGGGENLKF